MSQPVKREEGRLDPVPLAKVFTDKVVWKLEKEIATKMVLVESRLEKVLSTKSHFLVCLKGILGWMFMTLTVVCWSMS